MALDYCPFCLHSHSQYVLVKLNNLLLVKDNSEKPQNPHQGAAVKLHWA